LHNFGDTGEKVGGYIYGVVKTSELVAGAYSPGMLNKNRLRNALNIEIPTFIAYEQREKSVKELLNILAAATSCTPCPFSLGASPKLGNSGWRRPPRLEIGAQTPGVAANS